MMHTPKSNWTKSTLLLFLVMSIGFGACSSIKSGSSHGPLTIQDQGSFAIGGTMSRNSGTFDPIKDGAYNPTNQSSEGQTLHGDHAYVFYQVPQHSGKLPLVFLHGNVQSAKTWETTPDGREGFQNIFLRRRYPVYLVDQPRRGRAGKSTLPISITASADEQMWFGIFRLGVYPNLYLGVQFSQDSNSLNQFYRQSVPNTGPYDAQVNINAFSALFDKIGQGILVTHSMSGDPGWYTAIKNDKVRAIVALEPGGSFVFPEGENVEPLQFAGIKVTPAIVPREQFMKLTKIPIIIYFGDNIPSEPSTNPGQEQWRIFLKLAGEFRDVVNRNGGDVTLVHLPDVGIRGNTHFLMSDLNNAEIADHIARFLESKHLN